MGGKPTAISNADVSTDVREISSECTQTLRLVQLMRLKWAESQG